MESSGVRRVTETTLLNRGIGVLQENLVIYTRSVFYGVNSVIDKQYTLSSPERFPMASKVQVYGLPCRHSA